MDFLAVQVESSDSWFDTTSQNNYQLQIKTVMPIIKNKIFIYLATRYLTYGLQFLLSLIIAVRLGPYYLGIYGMVQLVLSYFAQVNFGIPHSLNVYLVHNKTDRNIQDEYSLNSFVLFTYVNVIVVIGAGILALLGYTQSSTYNTGKYLPLIIAIAVLTYYNNLLSTIIRFRNQVNILSLIGTIPVLVNMITVWFFKEENLVVALTVVNLLSCIATTAIGYFIGAIPKLQISSIKTSTQKNIVNKGLYLFLYNSCFYFILIAVRTIISGNYSVEEFGYFTFSYTIANAVMLLLDSLNVIVFPKTIDVLSGNNYTETLSNLKKLRVGYITSSHLMIYIALTVFPIIVNIFPKYEPALISMNMISLAILMNTNSYGYNTFLIAQNKEKLSANISIIAFVISVLFCCILVHWIKVDFSFVVLAMLIAYLVFSFLAAYHAESILYGEKSITNTLRHFFPIKLLVPYVIALTIIMTKHEFLVFVPLCVFLLLNFNDLSILKKIVEKLIRKPEIIDV